MPNGKSRDFFFLVDYILQREYIQWKTHVVASPPDTSFCWFLHFVFFWPLEPWCADVEAARGGAGIDGRSSG